MPSYIWAKAKNTKDFVIGETRIRPIANSNGHHYELESDYIVSFIDTEGSFQASPDGVCAPHEGYDHLAIRDVLVRQIDPIQSIPMLDILVLPDAHREAILETLTTALNQAAHAMIFKQWGFEKTIEKGKGLIFLFWGEPGTGKTMCAQGMAEHLKCDYTLLDNAKLQSSVPGQMERNIKEAFKEATQKNRVLILDECDSILTRRDEVGMILASEINVLLSELERFEGVCVLTTNRPITLDPALERRISLKLEFPRPDAITREKIWRNLIPKECPLALDVCFKTLALHDLPGGNIKNAILTAARRAVSKDLKEINLETFEVAIAREVAGQKAWQGSGQRSHLGGLVKIQEHIEMLVESGTGEKKKKRGFIFKRDTDDA